MRIPAQHLFCLGRVAQQLVHLGGAEILRVYFHQHFPGIFVDAFLVNALALPFQLYSGFAECQRTKLSHCVHLARGYYKVIRLRLLEYQPHTFYIISGVAPVTTCVKIAEI